MNGVTDIVTIGVTNGVRDGITVTTRERRSCATPTVTVCLIVLVSLMGATPLNADEMAPDFRLPTFSDPAKLVSLSDYRGRFVYVDFWASWCKPCREALPFYERLQSEIGSESLQIVGIGIDDDPDAARAFLEKWPVSYPTLSDIDGAVLRAYGVKTMPTGFLVDPDGRVRLKHRGFRKKDRNKLERALTEAINPP